MEILNWQNVHFLSFLPHVECTSLLHVWQIDWILDHFNCWLTSGAASSVTSTESSYFPHHFTEKNQCETHVQHEESPDNKELIDVASNSPSASWQRSSVKLFFARNTSETKGASEWSMSGLIKNQILSVVFNLLHGPSQGLAGLDLIDGFLGTCLSADWHIGAVKGGAHTVREQFTIHAHLVCLNSFINTFAHTLQFHCFICIFFITTI